MGGTFAVCILHQPKKQLEKLPMQFFSVMLLGQKNITQKILFHNLPVSSFADNCSAASG